MPRIASLVKLPPKSISLLPASYVRPLPAWFPIAPASAPSVTKALSEGAARLTVPLVTISSTVLAPSKEKLVVISTDPVTSISPAVTTLPVASSTVKLAPPTVRSALVISTPLVASTFPPKVT